MVEFEFNSRVDTVALVEFFARCGWEDLEAGVKLEWALASSEDWVICRADGELIGFGRSCRLDAVKRVVFDVLVDFRYRGGGLRDQIVALLSAGAGRLEEVSVFSQFDVFPPVGIASSGDEGMVGPIPEGIPEAPFGAYLGKKRHSEAHTAVGGLG